MEKIHTHLRTLHEKKKITSVNELVNQTANQVNQILEKKKKTI